MNKSKKTFNSVKMISLFVAVSLLFQLIPIGISASGQAFDENGIPINLQILNTYPTIDKATGDPIDKPISNTLYEINGNGVNTIMSTDSDGIASITGLLPGDYVVTELDVPSPYLINNVPMPVTIIDGETSQLSRETDMAKAIITVNKVEIGTNAPISGAVFEISNENNEILGTITSGADGIAKTEELVTGVYFVKEIIAPSGYILSDNIFQLNMFYVDNSTPLIEDSVTFEGIEVKGQVNLFSKEKESTAPIPGIQYRLLTGAGMLLGMYTTDDNGTISVNNLDFGDYTFSETFAPDGYVATYADYDFSVNNYEPVLLNTVYDHTKIDISLRDITNEEQLSGATLQVVNSEGNVVAEFDTTDAPHRLNGLPTGDYTLSQLSPAAGYVSVDDIPFTLISTINLQSLVMHNDFTKISVSNQNVTTKEEIAASLLQITKEGEVVREWESTDMKHEVTKLPIGAYTLTEKNTPPGYVQSPDIAFEILPTGDIQTVTMEKDYTKVNISIIDVNTDEFIPGTDLQILNSEGIVVYEWTSLDKPYTLTEVPVGLYVLREISTPDGYISSEDVEFTVSPTAEPLSIRLNKDYTKVQISLHDITTRDEITGASLKVTDSDGKTVQEWISGTIPHTIYRLPAGNYTLSEIETKEGYILTDDIDFEVESNGTIKIVEMKNDYTKIQIISSDSNTNEQVTGITFEIIDMDGKVVKEWKSSDAPYETKYLPVGEYILREISSADGYVVSNDVEFTITATENVQPLNTYHSLTKVEISLKDIVTNDEISGASLKILDADGKTVGEWVSTSTPHVLYGLYAGSYTLTQTSAVAGYILSEDIGFIIKNSETINVVEMKNSYTKIQIANFDSITDKQITGISFEIIDAEGKTVNEWDSTNAPYETKYLPIGKYILRETTSADGYVESNNVEFTVTATEKIQPITTYHSQIKTEVSLKDITTNKAISGASLEILDTDGNTVKEWTSETAPYVIYGLKSGNYTLSQLSALDGYILSEDISFIVTSSGTINTVEMHNDYTKIQVLNINADNKRQVSGISFKILDINKVVVREWESTEKTLEIDYLPVGEYILKETASADGYVTSKDVVFTIKNIGEAQIVKTTHNQTKIQISVQDIKTEKELADITMQIVNADGIVVQAWLSSENPQIINSLPVGKYTLLKINVPEGYLSSESIEFEVKNSEELQSLISKIDYTKVKLSFLDEETLSNLSGVTLQILDKDWNLVQELVAGVSMVIERLPFGTYTLRAKTDSDEESFMEDVLFEVGSSNIINTITIKTIKATETPEEAVKVPVEDTEVPAEDTEIVNDTEGSKEAAETESITEDTKEDVVEKFPPTGVESTTPWLISGVTMLLLGALLFLSTFKDKKKRI